VDFAFGVSEFEFKHCVGAGGGPVYAILVSHAGDHTLLDLVDQVVVLGDVLLGEALHIHGFLAVLKQVQLLAVV